MILADLLQKNVYPKIEMGRRDQLGRLEGPAAFVHIWYQRVTYVHTVQFLSHMSVLYHSQGIYGTI